SSACRGGDCVHAVWYRGHGRASRRTERPEPATGSECSEQCTPVGLAYGGRITVRESAFVSVPKRIVGMQFDHLQSALDSFAAAAPLLARWELRDSERGWRNLGHLASHLDLGRLQALSACLDRFLPRCPDPDMALNNLERFLASPAGAAQGAALLDNH